MANNEALGTDERIARGKALREKSIAEDLAFEERKEEIPTLLENSEHDSLAAFVTAHSVQKKALENRGSFEKEHRDELASVSLTHRAAAELLLDQMTELANAPGSSWADVGVPIVQESQIVEEVEVAQPNVTQITYSTVLGADRTY